VLIVIDLSESRVHLRDPDDFGRFSVTVEGGGDQGDLARVVDQSGLGRLKEDGQHEWDEGFAGMQAYAAGKGWVEDDGVVAHIEPRDGTA
jgi:hypothetical protein